MATHIHTTAAHLAASPEDYARLKLAKNHIEPWEERMSMVATSVWPPVPAGAHRAP